MPNIALSSGVMETVVDTATATGVTKSFPFSPPSIGGKTFGQITFLSTITGPVAAKAKLQISTDGGTTWIDYTPSDALDFIALPSQTVGIQGGALYRINITTMTSTNITIKALIG